jgi:hypothetical protein
MVGQSMDNTIVTYDAHKFRQNSKKTFKGHLSAGFACQVGFSPNGRCVRCVCWRWRWWCSRHSVMRCDVLLSQSLGLR